MALTDALKQAQMTPEQWERVKEVFEAAQDLSLDLRAAFVAENCGSDPEIRAEVENLLSGDLRAGSFLEKPVLGPLTTMPGDTIPHIFACGQIVSGRFEVIRFLGKGGMGEVYEARDRDLGERLALKTIRLEISSDQKAITRFKHEIQLARRVTHPNVCRMFDLQRHSSSPTGENPARREITFLTMELLKGETLAERLERQGRFTTADALPLIQQMAEALAAAHEVGVIHRDFKPSNVLLVDSSRGARAVVTDFGLARIAAVSGVMTSENLASSLTASGHILGTPAYMAPEQLEGGEVTPATDIYNLGLVIYEMVTGVRPFSDGAPFAGAFKRVKEPPPSPRSRVPDLDPHWDAAIMRCLEIDPAKRFANTGDVAADLAEGVKNLQVVPGTKILPVDGKPRAPTRHLGKGLAIFGVAAGIVLALFVPYFRHSLLNTTWVVRLHDWVRPAAQLGEGDSILVADFENLSGEKLFDRTISDLVAKSMQESDYVSVVDRRVAMEAIKRTGRTSVESIDAYLGRDICIRENYRALLAGQIVRYQSAYQIDVQLIDPRKGTVVLTESQPMTSGADLYDAVDKMVGRVRQRMGESLAQIEKGRPLAQVSTSSLEALQRYSLAFDKYAARDYDGALTFAESAVELDPNFAMAHLLLARIYDTHGLAELSYHELDLARQGLDKVTERERHLILAKYYYVHYNSEKAAEEYTILAELSPNDPEALRGLAETLSWTNQIRKSVEVQRKVLELNPGNVFDYIYLMSFLIRLNEFQEAVSTFQQARYRKLDSPGLHYYSAVSYWGLGDTATARQEFEIVRQSGDPYYENLARIYLASMMIYQGRLKEADLALRTGPVTRTDRAGSLMVARLCLLGRINLIRGEVPAARENARQVIKALFEGTPPILLQEAGFLAVDSGEKELGRELLARLRKMCSHPVGEYLRSASDSLEGATEFADGKPDAAIESQRRSAAYLLAFHPYARLGKAYQTKRDWRSAIEAYKQYLQFRGSIIDNVSPGEWVLAHLELARLYALTGDLKDSMQYYDDFLHLWAQADGDLKQVQEARTEREAVALRLPRP